MLAEGSLTPDHIVYTGARAVLADSLEELPGQAETRAGRKGPAARGHRQGRGNFPGGRRSAETGRRRGAGALRARRSSGWPAGRGGAHNLSPESADFIVNWEAEHYRAKALEGGRAPLAGKVALVTGAASGLGCGIALGLVEAGAAVAFCDIDADGAAAAASRSADPRRALAVRMDVTREDVRGRGFRPDRGHWGGVDIVVCAAGIAPPYRTGGYAGSTMAPGAGDQPDRILPGGARGGPDHARAGRAAERWSCFPPRAAWTPPKPTPHTTPPRPANCT